ncbi:hypothetical protein [Streptomyces capoamus]|uniref:hypothetical protein n=1 Tax=Streptomyces capoamus TaxID=68183 RepID=UPI003398E4D8
MAQPTREAVYGHCSVGGTEQPNNAWLREIDGASARTVSELVESRSIMRIRSALATAASGTALLIATMATPAQASASGWSYSLGGPIRSCASASCSVVRQTSYGDSVYWTNTTHSPAGNLWYKVTYPVGGYIYCGNIAEPC